MDGQGEIEQVQGVLTEFSRVEAGLAALRAKHGNTVYEVSTTAGMEAAKAARAEIREPRFAVEKVRKAAKAPLLAIGRRIDAEAVRITEAILAIETPIDDQIKAEEARKVAEREAKKAAEVERLRLEAAAKLKAEEERLAVERAAIAEERKKAEEAAAAERSKLAAERAKAEAEAAEAKREAEIELAAQRKAIAEAKEKADREAAEERARIKAMREAAEAEAKRVADAQAVVDAAIERELKREREEAERKAAAEQASFIQREGPEDPPAASYAVEAAPDDPAAVWVEINDAWEALDIHDIDAVELWANWVMSEGEKQAKRLTEALADRVA